MTFQLPRAMHEVQRYPLHWPPSRARTPQHDRKAKRWNANLRSAQQDLTNECHMAGIHDFALSLGIQPGTRAVDDVGAVLWFMQNVSGAWHASFYACDAFRDPAENVKAIAMTIQRLRLIEDYGAYTAEQAMRGAAYDALPPPEAPPRNWWEVLEVTPTTPRAVIDAAFKALAKQRHPDTAGGSTEAMQELQRAYEEAKAAGK